MTTIPDLLAARAVDRAPDVAAVEGERRVTHAELAEAARRRAVSLVAAGVRPADVVAVRARPSIEWWTTFLAITSLGAIHQGLHPRYRAQDLAVVLDDTDPTLVLDLVEDADPLPRAATRVDDLPAAGGALDVPAPDDRDVAVVIHTSGTSGTPKGALLHHAGLVHCAEVSHARLFDDDVPGVTLCNFPVNHVACVGDVCVTALAGGSTIVFQPEFDPVEALALVERHGVTVWGAIPVMLQLSVTSPAWSTVDLSSVRRVVWGGNPAPRGLVAELRRRVPLLTAAYGLTESTGNVTFTDDDASDDDLVTTIGRPDPAYDVTVADEAGGPVAPGEVGEVVVGGDHLFTGYLDRPEATEAALRGGRLWTGDLATVRDDGVIRLVGRRSSMFKSGGLNVYPREIELALESRDDVAAAAVVGIPDALYHEVGAAFAVAAPGVSVEPAVLLADLRGRLANYKVPKTLRVVDELPMLPVGKVDRRALAELASDGLSVVW